MNYISLRITTFLKNHVLKKYSLRHYFLAKISKSHRTVVIHLSVKFLHDFYHTKYNLSESRNA